MSDPVVPGTVDPAAPAITSTDPVATPAVTTPSTILTGTDPATEQTPAGDATPAGAPETYELAMPDGVTLDAEAFGKFEPLFRKYNLTNEAAQELITTYAESNKADLVSVQERLTQQHTEWETAVKTDPELGGKNFDTTAKEAQSALARFGTQGLKDYLNQTGLGSHPELVRVFAKIGKAMSEDNIVTGKNQVGDSLKDMYPTMHQQN